jgi:hypothetical protein
MSSRFGRNKRRRAREAIAALQKQAEVLAVIRRSDACIIRELRQELDDAREIAGYASVLFPAPAEEINSMMAPEVYRMRAMRPFNIDSIWDGSVNMSATCRDVPLPVMVSSISRDWLTESLHVKLHFDGIAVGYAVARETLCRIPAAALMRSIVREMAPDLVSKLKEPRT